MGYKKEQHENHCKHLIFHPGYGPSSEQKPCDYFKNTWIKLSRSKKLANIKKKRFSILRYLANGKLLLHCKTIDVFIKKNYF